jgi:hypothetical protein
MVSRYRSVKLTNKGLIPYLLCTRISLKANQDGIPIKSKTEARIINPYSVNFAIGTWSISQLLTLSSGCEAQVAFTPGKLVATPATTNPPIIDATEAANRPIAPENKPMFVIFFIFSFLYGLNFANANVNFILVAQKIVIVR